MYDQTDNNCRYSTRHTLMDPFTIATGVAGLVSLTTEIHGIVSGYISGAKSATMEANNFLVQITTLQAVLD